MADLLKDLTRAVNNRGLIPERREGVFHGKWKDHPKVKFGEWSNEKLKCRGKAILTSREWRYTATQGIINNPGLDDSDSFLIKDIVEALGPAVLGVRFVMEASVK